MWTAALSSMLVKMIYSYGSCCEKIQLCFSSAVSGLTFHSTCGMREVFLTGSYWYLDPHPCPRRAVISLHWSLSTLS